MIRIPIPGKNCRNIETWRWLHLPQIVASVTALSCGLASVSLLGVCYCLTSYSGHWLHSTHGGLQQCSHMPPNFDVPSQPPWGWSPNMLLAGRTPWIDLPYQWEQMYVGHAVLAVGPIHSWADFNSIPSGLLDLCIKLLVLKQICDVIKGFIMIKVSLNWWINL